MIESGMTRVAESMSLRAKETKKKLNMFCSFRSYLTAKQTSTLPPIAAKTIKKKNSTGQLYVLPWLVGSELLPVKRLLLLCNSKSKGVMKPTE